MPSFLTQIQALDTSSLPASRARIKPRRLRRQDAKDAAKSTKKAA